MDSHDWPGIGVALGVALGVAPGVALGVGMGGGAAVGVPVGTGGCAGLMPRRPGTLNRLTKITFHFMILPPSCAALCVQRTVTIRRRNLASDTDIKLTP
jgi:hypothetical protein